jgi:nucleoside-diphosphate-sugar epimerase
MMKERGLLKLKEITQCKSSVTFHPLPKDDPKRRRPDTSKLEQIAGWKPQVKFEEGLKRIITWFSSKRTQ